MSDDNKKEFVKITTPTFRVSFPNVFKPKSNFEGQKPSYSIQMLFDKDADIEQMKKAAFDAGVKKWGPDKKKWPKFRYPTFADGNEKANKLASHKDMVVVNARSMEKPGVIDKDYNEILEPAEFYAGCYARATLSVYAYEKLGNAGISFGLQNIMKIKDGKPLGGKKNAKDDFAEIDLSDEDFDESADGTATGDENDFDF